MASKATIRKAKAPRRLDDEFTPSALRATLRVAGKQAAKSAYQKGRPVTFLQRVGGRAYLVHRFESGIEIRRRVYLPPATQG